MTTPKATPAELNAIRVYHAERAALGDTCANLETMVKDSGAPALARSYAQRFFDAAETETLCEPTPVEPAGGKIVFEEHRRPALAVDGELDALRETVRKLHEAQRAQEQEILELQKLTPIGPMELVRYVLARLRRAVKCI